MRRPEPDDPAAAAAATFNMTPMIDVTFQLIVVFLCTMKFRTLDEKLEAHLPRDRGTETLPAPAPPETVLRLRIAESAPGGPARLVLAGERLGTTDEGDPLWARLESALAAFRARDPAIVGEIDAAPAVEHGAVMRALDGFHGAGVGKVRFRGTPAPR